MGAGGVGHRQGGRGGYGGWREELIHDLRFAFRSLRRRPVFAMVAALTLGTGVGAATAMFTVIDGVLLRPLPVFEEERLHLLRKELRGDESLVPFPVADLVAFQESSRAFQSVAGVQYDGAWPWVADLGSGEPVSVNGALTSGGFFRVLGVRPAAGRIPGTADEVPGTEAAAVISHRLWQGRFGGDPGVVGRSVRLMGNPVRIVGVAPEGFEYPRGAEVWVPLGANPALLANRQFAPFSLIGRLRPGATAEQAQAEASAFVRSREAVYLPGEPREQRAVLIPFTDLVVGELRPALLLLGAAVLLVLVVAGVNLANLLLIRAADRQREIALRVAIGAGRGRVVRQMLAEGAALAVLGTALGVVLAYLAVSALVAAAPAELPRMDEVRLNGRVLGVASLAALLTALGAALAPVLWAGRTDMFGSLRGGTRSVGASGRATGRGKRLLVVTQVALAVVIAAGAGLLARSVLELQRVEMGFAAPGLSVVKVEIPGATYRSPAEHQAFFERLAARLEATPGVQAATPMILTPFSGLGGWDARFTLEGQGVGEAAANPALNQEAVRPNYFGAMGIALRRGRGFTDADRADGPPVAVVSEQLARMAWPGADPIGKRIKLGTPDSPAPWTTVVGVVPEVRYRDLVAPPPSVYLPLAQTELRPRFVAVRAAGDGGVLAAVRAAAAELDPSAQVLEASTISQLVAAPLARPRFNAMVLAVFAVIAVGLAAVGLYGVMASDVAQRRPEIGVRVALGAQSRDVMRLIVQQGMRLALVGVGLGVVASLGITRVLRSVLYEVSPGDPVTLLAVGTLLLLSALFACVFPAWRALRVDAMQVLRSE